MLRLTTTLLALALAAAAPAAFAKAKVGEAAPAFTLTDADGKSHSLADFKGKTVVLEWHNPECPFVKKHYSGNMQGQQKDATGKEVVWLTVNSGAAGKQGSLDGAAAKAYIADKSAAPTAYLMDASGDTGRAYDAKTTPHMYVIDGDGTLRYAGAIDSKPTADTADIASATQYVSQALAELSSGKPVSTPVTQPYGCSVKY